MIIDPSTRIYNSPGELPSFLTVPPGQISIPRYREDKEALYYKRNGQDYRVQTLLEYRSQAEAIVDASSIPMTIPDFIGDLRRSVRSLTPIVVNRVAQYGFTPGQMVIPVRGVGLEVNASSIVANIFVNGVRIVRKDGNRGEVRCNVSRWALMYVGIFYDPQ